MNSVFYHLYQDKCFAIKRIQKVIYSSIFFRFKNGNSKLLIQIFPSNHQLVIFKNYLGYFVMTKYWLYVYTRTLSLSSRGWSVLQSIYNTYNISDVLFLNQVIGKIYQYSQRTSFSISLLLADNLIEYQIKSLFCNNRGKTTRVFSINQSNATFFYKFS